MYVAGENVRGDFVSTAPAVGMTVQSHMIQYGGFVYTWSDMAPMGFKTPRVAMGAQKGTTAMSGQQGFDMGVAMAYDCKDWTPDLTKFDLPAKVKFSEAIITN